MALLQRLRRSRAPAPSVAPPRPRTPADDVEDLRQLVETEGQLVLGRQPPQPAWQVDPVVSALARRGTEEAVAALAEGARRAVRPDAPLTLALLQALGEAGSEAATDALVVVAIGRSQDLADRAAVVLPQTPHAFARAARRLADPDSRARQAAARLVARLDGDQAVEALLPLLADDDRTVAEATADALAVLADDRAVAPLLRADARACVTVRSGLDAVTTEGRLSPYLLAAGRIVSGDQALGWTLSSRPAYEAQEELEALLAEARAAAGVPRPAWAAVRSWAVADVVALLDRGAGPTLRYADAGHYLLDLERCRRLGLAVAESTGETSTTVYGERTQRLATVSCADGELRLEAS